MTYIEVPRLSSLFRCFVTDEMKKITSKIDDKLSEKIKYKIGLITSGYYMSQDKWNNFGRTMGHRGRTGADLVNTDLPPGDTKRFTIKFTLDKVPNDKIESIKLLFDTMKKTNGNHNNTYRHYKINKLSKEVKFGLRKTQLFIDTYLSFKKNGIIENEIDLARYGSNNSEEKYISFDHKCDPWGWGSYNSDFATEEKYQEENKDLYIETYNGDVYEDINHSKIEVELLNSDLTDSNTNIMLKIIELIKQ